MMFGLNPWALLGAGAIFVGSVTGAFFYGRSTGIDHQLAIEAKVMMKATAAIEKGRKAIDILNGRVTEARNAQSTESDTIRHDAAPIILRPIYRTPCVDADGVRLLDRAVANANRGLAGQSADDAARVPESATESGR
ncbi:hypothetical protein [Sphingomonas sp. SRS2]|uniref:hypothetical protein n=1 Tax=Sphingomonas sp. SRS2 TaxID=133190 RepID=UPI000618471A|nr:hypothetical protein [Sphingomonas sp. SRS2]KKC24443.1 hypothetical protein WP12_19320 [Sphingomonas sp. SRS2]